MITFISRLKTQVITVSLQGSELTTYRKTTLIGLNNSQRI